MNRTPFNFLSHFCGFVFVIPHDGQDKGHQIRKIFDLVLKTEYMDWKEPIVKNTLFYGYGFLRVVSIHIMKLNSVSFVRLLEIFFIL